MSPFIFTLLAVSLPIVAVLLAAAWLGHRGIGPARVPGPAGGVLARAALGGRAGGR